MHQDIVQELYSDYLAYGYISENRIFDVVVRLDIPLDEVDAICELLLMKGVIIKSGNEETEKSDYDRSQVDFELVYKEVVEIDDTLASYISEIKNIQSAQHREWRKLYQPAQSGNAYARERIIAMNLRSVVRMALWHHNKYGMPIAEAIQDGNYGLVNALRKFDIRKHNNFSQYAAFWVRQMIMRHANTRSPLIYYPVHVKDKMFAVMEIADDHSCFRCDEYYVCPQLIDKIAEKLSCSSDEAVNIIGFLSPMESIEAMLETDVNAFSDAGSMSIKMSEEFDGQELSFGILEVLQTLNEREAAVLTRRFGLDGGDPLTLEDVGGLFNVTRERIRQIEAKALRKLRKSFKAKQLKAFW